MSEKPAMDAGEVDVGKEVCVRWRRGSAVMCRGGTSPTMFLHLICREESRFFVAPAIVLSGMLHAPMNPGQLRARSKTLQPLVSSSISSVAGVPALVAGASSPAPASNSGKVEEKVV